MAWQTCVTEHMIASSSSQENVGAAILKVQVNEVKAERSTFMSYWPLCSFFPSRKGYVIDSASPMPFLSNPMQSSRDQGEISMITK